MIWRGFLLLCAGWMIIQAVLTVFGYYEPSPQLVAMWALISGARFLLQDAGD